MSEIRKKQSEDYDIEDSNKIEKNNGSNIEVPDAGPEDISMIDRNSQED
jgi:hypothetical protein